MYYDNVCNEHIEMIIMAFKYWSDRSKWFRINKFHRFNIRREKVKNTSDSLIHYLYTTSSGPRIWPYGERGRRNVVNGGGRGEKH